MKQDEWQQVKEIFHQARELVPEKRAEFLEQVCGENAELREQVNILLESYESDFLEEPLLNEPTKLFEGVLDETGTIETDIQASPETDQTQILTQDERKQTQK